MDYRVPRRFRAVRLNLADQRLTSEMVHGPGFGLTPWNAREAVGARCGSACRAAVAGPGAGGRPAAVVRTTASQRGSRWNARTRELAPRRHRHPAAPLLRRGSWITLTIVSLPGRIPPF
jgi:hypothetical protein